MSELEARPQEEDRILNHIQMLKQATLFEIDRLDFDFKRITMQSYKFRLDTVAGYTCFTAFSLLTKRIWPALRPIDSILYRNRFLVPKLPDWAAKITNLHPAIYSITASYSLWTAAKATRGWKKCHDDLLEISVRIDEKRKLVSFLQQRFGTTPSDEIDRSDLQANQ